MRVSPEELDLEASFDSEVQTLASRQEFIESLDEFYPERPSSPYCIEYDITINPIFSYTENIFDKTCPICLEKDNDKVQLNCKHFVCEECFKEWHVKKLNLDCCLCRKEFINEEIRKLNFIREDMIREEMIENDNRRTNSNTNMSNFLDLFCHANIFFKLSFIFTNMICVFLIIFVSILNKEAMIYYFILSYLSTLVFMIVMFLNTTSTSFHE
tara:strand:+ start:11568 stop:12206 length:639 start_codon:yes stop_codon:yes gene_type:complete